MEKGKLCGVTDLLFSQHTVVAQKKALHQAGKFPAADL